jgi:hypothetical protein
MKRGLLLAACAARLLTGRRGQYTGPGSGCGSYSEPLDAGTLKEISTLPRKLAGAMRAVAGG